MEEIKVIEGKIFKDERGQISSLNNFRFEEVERFYSSSQHRCHSRMEWASV